MREAATQEVRLALDRAQDASRALNQEFVGTEHLMLGLLDAGGAGDGLSARSHGEAVRALLRTSINLKELRNRIIAGLPRAGEEPVVTGDLPYSPRARQTMNLALAKAQAAHEPAVSTRYLLRALLDESDGIVCQSLRDSGIDLDGLLRQLAEPTAEPEI